MNIKRSGYALACTTIDLRKFRNFSRRCEPSDVKSLRPGNDNKLEYEYEDEQIDVRIFVAFLWPFVVRFSKI